MKRFRWCILALLLVGGLVLVLALKPQREPLELTLIGRTNDLKGQPFVIVRLRNQSPHEFAVIARTWNVALQDSELSRFRSQNALLPAGALWDAQLPAPAEKTPWKVNVVATRKPTWVERFMMNFHDGYPAKATVRKDLNFEE